MNRLLKALTAVLLIAATPSLAAELSRDDMRQIRERAVAEERAALKGDWAALTEHVPARLRPALKDALGFDYENPSLNSVLGNAVRITRYENDVDRAIARTLPDGTSYLLVPTRITMGPRGRSGPVLSIAGWSVAFQDNDDWYLYGYGTEEGRQAFLRNYPKYTAAKIPAFNVTVLGR